MVGLTISAELGQRAKRNMKTTRVPLELHLTGPYPEEVVKADQSWDSDGAGEAVTNRHWP